MNLLLVVKFGDLLCDVFVSVFILLLDKFCVYRWNVLFICEMYVSSLLFGDICGLVL